jgi:hypothetical protein
LKDGKPDNEGALKLLLVLPLLKLGILKPGGLANTPA